jgi:hypothetical protein
LIDCVSEHIHLALRYLIVNTIHSLKCLLSTDIKEYQETLSDTEKNNKIKEYSILLSYLYDTLRILLLNLLSSHVDNYRDNLVIEHTVSLLILLINYLYEIYSYNSYKDQLPRYNLHVVEYIQKLFEVVLKTFKEICKFNTTIKLNFEKILERLAEKPSNKGAMIYILSFMYHIVNNEYTVETFIEHMTKVHPLPVIDVYNDIESNSKGQVIKLGHLCSDRNFLQYAIEIGMTTNNDWILTNCVNLVLSIQRCYINKTKLKIYEQINDDILNIINSTFNRLSKVNSKILEDKVYLSLIFLGS